MKTRVKFFAIEYQPFGAPSGLYLLAARSGFTAYRPERPSIHFPARLYPTQASAAASLRNYCRGRWRKESPQFNSEGGFIGGCDLVVDPTTKRYPADYKIVPATITLGE